MLKLSTCALVGLPLLLASGCTPLWERQARSVQNAVEDRPIVEEARTYRTDPLSTATVSSQDMVPATIADLDQLIRFGLQRNPTMRARHAAVMRQSYTVQAAGILPPPRVQIAPLGEMAQTATGEVTVMAGVTQAFPAAGSLNAQVLMAEAELEMAEASLREYQVRLAQNIRTAYFNLQVAQKSKRIVDEQQQLLRQLHSSIVQRIAIGTAKQSDAHRILVEIDQLETMKRTWEERIDMANAMLRNSLSLGGDVELPPIKSPISPVDRYREADLLEHARQLRSDILANQAQQQKAASMVAGARARYLPEFGVSFNYNWVADHNVMARTSGKDQWWVGLSMSVPIWEHAYSAGSQAAAIARDEALLAQKSVADVLQRDVRTALAAWSSAHEQLQLFNNSMLDHAQRAFDAESAHYQGGTSTFLDVIQAWKNILMIQLSIERLHRDCGVAEAMVLSAAGMSFSSQLSSVSPQSPNQK